MKVLKIIFSVVWLLGWGFGAGALLQSHWYISIPMFIVAAIPGVYDTYKVYKENKERQRDE